MLIREDEIKEASEFFKGVLDNCVAEEREPTEAETKQMIDAGIGLVTGFLVNTAQTSWAITELLNYKIREVHQ